MFLVKTYLDKSKIHGIGLFAGENIKKGRLVYKPSPRLDLYLAEKTFKKLDKNSKNTIRHYGYLKKDKKIWHLAFDDIRFCNHSRNGNITRIKKDGTTIAKKNIKKGEEILQNFEEFETLREELK